MISLLLALAQAERPVWDEEQLVEVTEVSLDILPWHHYVLRTQQLLDRPANFAELAFHGAPARYALPNGDVRNGSLVRLGVGAGFGVGRPTSGGAAFVGILADYGLAQGSSPIASDQTLGMAADAVIYGGLAVKGWTATAAALPSGGFAFEQDLGGTPRPDTGISSAYTLYNQEGVALGAIRATDARGVGRLASVRGELRPEKLLERTELRRLGVFGVGLARYAEGLDIYQDHGPGEQVPATWELPLSADDLGEKGVRVSIAPELAPRPTVRRAVVGWLHDSEKLVAGAQGGLVNRAGAVRPTAQVYAVFHPEWFKYFSIYGVPRITVSYSYNVPDPVAFFPVDRAHVVGVQYIYGREEFARPLLPIYRSPAELEASAASGSPDP